MTRPNLSDLAAKYGSDKGIATHRYTRLYDMLFQPYRDAEITFLEMGLQIGGPEHRNPADRETTDAPSARMWLEYFTKARIIGLDVSDFSWLAHPRFEFVRCDMNDRTALARAAAETAESYDIVIDDASHASAHQQDAFLEFFPRLRSGGLYIVEDLQWQPRIYERKRPGYPKTAELFDGFIQSGAFSHPNTDYQTAFNGLADQISGCFLFQKNFVKSLRDKIAVIHKR